MIRAAVMSRSHFPPAWVHPLSLGALFWLIAGTPGCGEKSAPPPPPPPEVVVAPVVQRDVPIEVEWVGTVDGNTNAQIRARVQGYLQSRDYNEGTQVKAGDLLFTIDPRPYRATLDQARGDLERASAALTKSQQDVARYTPLAAEGAISQQELDNAVQALRAAKAQTASAQAAVEKAQLNLDWTRIQAPFDGVAGIATAHVGDLVSENTVLTTLSQLDPVRVSFSISEREYLRYASRIQVDGTADADRPANLELVLADGSLYPRRGTALLADRQVEGTTGTLTIVAQFPNPNILLRPGQYAKVRAAVETKSGALLVPQRAVVEVQGLYQVMVVGDDGKVEARRVTPGARAGAEWIIEEGLRAADKVIVEGLQKARHGMTVQPKLASASASSTK